MKQYVAVGIAVVAGAALIEAALIPGLVIGGAAVLAPQFRPKALLRRRKARPAASSRQSNAPDAGQALASSQTPLLPRFAVGQAIAKTITYRVVVTTLDFTANYIVIGELATAAGLSTINLVAGPLFYFAHEAAWNYLGHPDSGVELPLLTPMEENPEKVAVGIGGFTLSRALAKTITFRTFASIMDFTTNYVVVGDVGQAVILSATGFVLGPFVYYGHEKAWGYFGDRAQAAAVSDEARLLPAPA